jgi:hypothetical protein
MTFVTDIHKQCGSQNDIWALPGAAGAVSADHDYEMRSSPAAPAEVGEGAVVMALPLRPATFAPLNRSDIVTCNQRHRDHDSQLPHQQLVFAGRQR